MNSEKNKKKVLVLLIGEVIEDPRVYKTCASLCDCGADVTVVCTNPSGRAEREICGGFSVIRFPHREEFFLKKAYNSLQDFLRPGFRRAVSQIHEEVPSSPLRAFIRNAVLSMNFRHHMRSTMRINRMMAEMFCRAGSKQPDEPPPQSGEPFDLVHCNDVDTLPVGNTLKKRGVAKEVLYDAHEFWPGIGVHGSAPNKALRGLEAEGIAEVDYVVTVNRFIAEMMKNEYDLENVPAVVMNCPRKYEGLVMSDTVHSPVRVLYQGKVQAFRGLEQLVLAFKHIEGAELTVSGYGPMTERLALLAASEGIERKVRLTGRFAPEDAMSIIAEHDIGILPFDPVTLSIMYSSPNKLFDYAMGGLAMAASGLPFLKEFIEGNDLGMTFPNNDPKTIADAINTMISDSGKLREFKCNARRSAMEHYFWDKQFSENYPWLRPMK